MSTAILAQVAPLIQSPRKGILELLELAENISHDGLIGMKVWAEHMVADHPRYPVAISVDVRGKRADIVELMRLAEMTDDAGMRTLLQRATTRYPLTSADIVKFPKQTARMEKKPQVATT